MESSRTSYFKRITCCPHDIRRKTFLLSIVIHLEINMFWDGLFHAMVWLLTMLGLTMMFHTMNTSKVRFPSRMFYGSLLAGWEHST